MCKPAGAKFSQIVDIQLDPNSWIQIARSYIRPSDEFIVIEFHWFGCDVMSDVWLTASRLTRYVTVCIQQEMCS